MIFLFIENIEIIIPLKVNIKASLTDHFESFKLLSAHTLKTKSI